MLYCSHLTLGIEACFVCEKDSVGGDPSREPDMLCCRYCPSVRVDSLSGPELLKHMAAHILHDVWLRDVDNICGLCLSSTGDCCIYLVKKGKTITISKEKSRCPNFRQVKLKAASTHTTNSPSSNHPMTCPLCPSNSPAIWKYNLRQHIQTVHPTANVNLYQQNFQISDAERVLLKAVLLAKPRILKKRRWQQDGMLISELHSTRMVLR